MSLNLLNLFNVIESKVLIATPNRSDTDEYKLPAFNQGESPTLNYYLLTRNLQGGIQSPWTKIAPAAYSLRVGIYTSDAATQLYFQDTFTDDTPNFGKLGILSANSVNITAALGAATSIEAKLEIDVTDSGGSLFKPYQRTVTILKQFMPAGAPTVAVGEVAATQSWVKGTFAPVVRAAGFFEVWTTPSGTPVAVTIGDDLQFKLTPLVTPP